MSTNKTKRYDKAQLIKWYRNHPTPPDPYPYEPHMATKGAVPPHEWQWYGKAAHFVCGRWCRFHMATRVGEFLVSTVGEYVHPRHSGGSERAEAEWMAKNGPGEDIGYERKYETMVFVAGDECTVVGCNCGQPTVASHEIDFAPYNDARAARAGHLELCYKWAAKQDWEGPIESNPPV